MNPTKTINTSTLEIQKLVKHARLNILQKTPSQAVQSLNRAWELASELEEIPLSLEILQLYSSCETPKFQHKWIRKAIELAQTSGEAKVKKCIGALYAELARTLHNFGRHADSLSAFRDALKYYEQYGSQSDTFRMRLAIGRQLRAIGKIENALEIQRVLLSELDTIHMQDARLFEELAECLNSLGKREEAQMYFEKAYLAFTSDTWVPDNLALKLKRMKDMGKVRAK